ncbi:carbohydrate binding domain-containing protein [Spirochaetia bacterium 38H-sp]|uniref:Carbohydrate binding domain-containing protein n=1 Tax=Rarispira pelagica TaxID=3141764 RepID=A0ABU9UCX4_9SPIR
MKYGVISVFVIFVLISFSFASCSSAPAAVEEPEDKTAVVISSNDFEDSQLEPWVARGEGVSVEVSNAFAHSGSFSVYVSGRTQNWNGVQADLLSLIASGKNYHFSVWVYQNSGESKNMYLTVERTYKGDKNWDRVAEISVPSGEWVELSGDYSVPRKDVSEFVLYVEAEDATLDFYIDDVFLSKM